MGPGRDWLWVESRVGLCDHAGMPINTEPVQALVIVDVQRAFVTGERAVPAHEQLVAALTGLLERARTAGAVVIHLQNDGPAGADDEPDQPGWELHFPTVTSERETVIRKEEDNGFAGTDLADHLERHGVRRIAVVGVMSEMCVLATARAALERHFGVVMPHDGHATYDIPPAPGSTEGVPAALASRVAEWALGDEVEIVARTTDVRF